MEKLHSELDFRLLEQYSVFLRKFVNVITSFNNCMQLNVGKGIPCLRESVNYLIISVQRQCFTPFSRIAHTRYVFSNCC